MQALATTPKCCHAAAFVLVKHGAENCETLARSMLHDTSGSIFIFLYLIYFVSGLFLVYLHYLIPCSFALTWYGGTGACACSPILRQNLAEMFNFRGQGIWQS